MKQANVLHGKFLMTGVDSFTANTTMMQVSDFNISVRIQRNIVHLFTLILASPKYDLLTISHINSLKERPLQLQLLRSSCFTVYIIEA